MTAVYTPGHAPPSPMGIFANELASLLSMVLFIVVPIMLALLLMLLIARRRGALGVAGRGLAPLLGRRSGVGVAQGGFLTADKTGLNTDWHALGILVKETSTELVHLVKLTPTNDVWTILEDPSVIIGLTEEHFITHIDGVPTAVLIGMYGSYVPVSRKEVLTNLINFSPAVVCVEKNKVVDESGEREVATVLDPYSTQSIILNAIRGYGGARPGVGLDSNIACEVYGSVAEALNVAPSATALVSINDALVLVPVSKTVLRSTELEIGLDRMNALNAANMVTILKKLNALINAQMQKARVQSMRIIYIAFAMALILMVLYLVFHI